MKVVKKKIWPEYFESVRLGQKNFELRKDEDCVEVGDLLVLEEYSPSLRKYTGRVLERPVKYVLRDALDWGLRDGYCIIGF